MIWLVCLILKRKDSSILLLLIDSFWLSVQIKPNKFSMSMSQILPIYAFTEIQFFLDFLYFYLLNIILIFTSSPAPRHPKH